MTDHVLVIGSPWKPFGLRDDPFFQQPLQPRTDAAAPRPISLFVGRDEELRLLANQIVGSSNSRAIIQGDAGVGKTSFVSRMKTALATQHVLTHENPIRVTAGMTARQFLAEVLKVLLQLNATNMAQARGFESVTRAAKRAASVGAEDAFWRRIGRIVDGEDSIAGGITLGWASAQREHVRIPSEVSDGSLFDELARALELLSRQGRRRVLFHINNLETLTREAARDAAGLMQEVRDALLFDYGHWLFVGTTGIEDAIFRANPQVGGIIPLTTTLGPLSSVELSELLQRRYQHLRVGLKFVPPVAPDVAARLYQRYRGHLRDFLRLLSSAVQHHAASAPGEPLDAHDVIRIMAPRYWVDVLVRRVGHTDAEYLARTLANETYDAEFRVTDIASATSLTQAGASKLITRLAAAHAIHQTRRAGKSVFYRVTHADDTIALGLL